MASLSHLEALLLDVLHPIRLTIVHSEIKKWNLVLVDEDAL